MNQATGPQRRRRLTEIELVVASHNPGKVREIRALVEPFGLTVLAAGALGLAEPEETGDSFAANALIKAKAAAQGARRPALADDSGLCVDALDGAPGIRSARWAGPQRDFGVAMTRIARALGDTANRRAHFVCALALCWPDGDAETFDGRVYGTLTFPPRGDKGFGYDPIFVPDGHTITFGEMDPSQKDALSHRADAFRQLAAASLTRR